MKCHYCDQEFDRVWLRPYGPGGALVCFPCATSPERNEATEAAMYATIEAAIALSPVGSVVLDADGPHPFSPEAVQ